MWGNTQTGGAAFLTKAPHEYSHDGIRPFLHFELQTYQEAARDIISPMPADASLALPNQTTPDLHGFLHHLFGFGEFRALQEEAVGAAVEGRDVLVVMPTGAGKSLCFQLPAAISPGVTIVVSPLVALMRDQVDALQNRTAFRDLGCAYLNSLQTPDEQRQTTEHLRAGNLKLVYIAPERFRSQSFLEALKSVEIARFVVDEAHCISEWGHDFRPDYLSLKPVVESLGNPPLMAVTATATLRVQQSIVENLGMREPARFIGGFNRPNLHFAALRCKSESDRQERLARALPRLSQMGGSGLIYVATRKQCEEVAALAQRALATVGKSAAPYHAGMDANTRNTLQSSWLTGQTQVLVATNAFGMGIDKPDVRFVVHYAYPDSLESYYQEAGRAGRDGRKSRCVIMHHFADRRTREWFIDNDAMTPEDVQAAHNRVVARARIEAQDNGSDGLTARIPRAWWSQALGWNEVKARLALGELERAKLVQRLGETGEETIIRIMRRDFPVSVLGPIRQDLGTKRDERYRRLDEMTAYCKTTLCRRRTTLAYFGDLERPETGGFCCDNCDNRPALDAAAAARMSTHASRKERVAMPLRVDGSDIHSLLQGMDALFPKVGKARLNKLLRGSSAKDVQRFKNENCPLFNALRGASESQVDDFLERLIELGFMHQADEEDYFVCTITNAGREAWQGQSEIEVRVPGSSSVLSRGAARTSNGSSSATSTSSGAPNGALDSDESALFEALRTWRRGEASAHSLPPYCVLADRALLEIARHKPQSEAALKSIPGIGDAKLQRYGKAVLDITRGETSSQTSFQPSKNDSSSAKRPSAPHMSTHAGDDPPARALNASNGNTAGGASSNGAHSRPVASGEVASSAMSSNGAALSGAVKTSNAVAALSGAVADLEGPVVDTYVMLQEGLDIEEIAQRRELDSETVWSHVEEMRRAGFLDDLAAQSLVPDDVRERIQAALSSVPAGMGLKAVWEKLGGEIDYGPIRCVAGATDDSTEVL